jgi:hypothetical protein
MGLGPLGCRTAAANSMRTALGASLQEVGLGKIELTADQLRPPDIRLINPHQSALARLAHRTQSYRQKSMGVGAGNANLRLCGANEKRNCHFSGVRASARRRLQTLREISPKKFGCTFNTTVPE